MDFSKFQLKRVNPFQGLVIDADTWRDAHNYHRDQQRLHVLAFHGAGIVSGLDVTANNPADTSVNISPGMAIDPDGNVIIMPQKQHYRLQTREKTSIYLVIQFREIPGEPYQPPEQGQPTRILEAYRLQERDHLAAEPYVELARIDFDPVQGAIRNAKNVSSPAANEINLGFREEAVRVPSEAIHIQPKEVTLPKETVTPRETVTIGAASLGEAGKNLHVNGLRNLIREFNRQTNFSAVLEEDINLKRPLNRYNLIYLTGSGRFELTAEQQATLDNFLRSGGAILGDGCSDAAKGSESKGPKEFGLAFNRTAGLLNRKLGIVQREHPILCIDRIFAECPQGCEPGMLLEGGNMICSSSDYGCAWEGGHHDQPLTRDIIRNALEIGINIVAYAQKAKVVGVR